MKNTIFATALFFVCLLVSCADKPTDNNQNSQKDNFRPDNAGVSVQHSGRYATIVRMNGNDRIFWLPIQESMGEADVRIISDNTQVGFFRIRLAKDSIDYFVPLDISRFEANNIKETEQRPFLEIRTFLPENIKRENMICWQNISTEQPSSRNGDFFRPLYHHTPENGWMNDPNGMFYDAESGLWHLYYQYNPYGSMWGNMHWAHSVSKDLVTWEHLPIAIMPTAIGTIFSGSCVIDTKNTAGFGEKAIVAIYTAEGQSQTQNIAYSLDGGTTFTHYSGNPVLTDTIADFRDPKVFWYQPAKQWIMTLACQQEIRFYSSKDLKHWKFESRFGKEYGNHNGVWECPDLVCLSTDDNKEHKWVLIVNINPGGPFGGSATQYFIGDFDGKTFTCLDDPKEQKWLDYGKDHYATVTWHQAPDNRTVALGWMSNWQYANQLPTTQFRSQNTVARDLGLYIDDNGEYRVSVKPSKEILALKGDTINAIGDNKCAIVEIEVPRAEENAIITLSNYDGEKVVMTYNFKKNCFTMDRSQSGITDFSSDFPTMTSVNMFRRQDTYRLLLFIDRCSIEAFDADGDWAMTNLVYNYEPYYNVEVKGGKATIYECRW